MSGLDRIAQAFAHSRAQQRAAFMPYFTLGYPDRVAALEVITALAAESDLMELGAPFSDPIADGPTIQRSTQAALAAGTTMAGCLEMVHQLRGQGVQTPALIMSYYNPILAYGVAAYTQAARQAGVDGLIVPDLPPEEAAELEGHAQAQGLAYIFFLAPTSHAGRMAEVLRRAQGFMYIVSLTGVTGARHTLAAGLSDFMRRVRQQSATPAAVGFGISTPAQAAQVGRIADGVIVGSALLNAFDVGGVTQVAALAHDLRQALTRPERHATA